MRYMVAISLALAVLFGVGFLGCGSDPDNTVRRGVVEANRNEDGLCGCPTPCGTDRISGVIEWRAEWNDWQLVSDTKQQYRFTNLKLEEPCHQCRYRASLIVKTLALETLN